MGARSAVECAVVLWLGIACGASLGIPGAWVGLALAIPCAWLAWIAPDRVGTVALLLALAAAGGARGAAQRAVWERAAAHFHGDDAARWLSGRIVEPPLRESGEPTAIVALDRGPRGDRERMLAGPDVPPAGTRVRLRLTQGCDAEWGDRIVALARLDPFPGVRNPGGFDARAAARALDLAGTGRALAAQVDPARGLAGWPRATAARWRRAIERRLAAGLSPGARELVVPLVIGDRSALPTDLGAALRASGLVHLLALSGLHVAWLAALARGLAAAVGLGNQGRAIAGALCALFYAAIAGPLPSLLRAVVTELLLGFARLLERALDPVQALALAALGLLVAAPGWAGDLGFQLSFAATLGLVTIGPWLEACVPARRRWLAAAFVPTLSAQLAAQPLMIARMHALSWAGMLANLIAVPVSGLLLTAAWLGALFECALPGSGGPWFSACEALAAALRAIAATGARLPGALIGTGAEPGIVICATLGAALLVVGLPAPRHLDARLLPMSRRRVLAAGPGAVASALAFLLVASARPLRPPQGSFWIAALDVGQGDAIALGFRDGWWLVDSGPRTPHFDAGETMVLPFCRWGAVRRLERLVLTHDDGDHTGGARAVLRGLEVGQILSPPAWPGVPGPAARFRTRAVAEGETLHREPLVVVRWPPRPRAAPPDRMPIPHSDNRAALVLEVGEGKARMLLLADVDSVVEEALAVEPGVALLKVAHHGSASSSGGEFLARLRPRAALISVGRRNAFGHPDRRALERLRRSGAAVLRTDRDGALWLEVSSRGVRRIDWRRGPPGSASSEPRPTRSDAALRDAGSLARCQPRW